MAASATLDGPIYIGGLARSGKTYMRLMLAAHPDVFFSKRTNLWTHHHSRYGDLSIPANLDRCLRALLENKHVRALQPDEPRLRRELSDGPMTYERLFALLHSHQAERLGKGRWGDQTEGIEACAPRLLAADSRAVIIHLIRDPRDRYEALMSRGSRRTGPAQATAAWIRSAELALQNQRDFPNRYRVVRYEALAARPAQTLDEVAGFLGLTATPDMLALGHASRFAIRPGNCPLVTDYIGRFRDEVSPGTTAYIQERASALLTAFGYVPEPLHLAWPDRLRRNCLHLVYGPGKYESER
jgi:hypothetical protein